MTSLDRIEIEGFKSIRSMDLELRELNVLIGANAAGKSNFIEAFRLLNHIVEKRLQRYVEQAGGANSLLYFGSETTELIEIRLTFEPNTYRASLMPTPSDKLTFASEVITYLGPEHEKPYEIPLGSYHRETQLYEESSKHSGTTIADHVIRALKSWKVYHFHDTSSTAKVKKTTKIDDNELLRPDAANLAARLFLFQERYPDHFRSIVKTIQLAAPFFGGFNLRPNPLNPDTIQLEWRHKDSDAYFNAHALSDGTLRFICLTTLLLQPDLPSTILIDEPELGLHPYAIVLLASMLKSAATKTQVIVSTQSVPLVNQFTPEDLIVVEQNDGQSEFKRLETKQLEDWLEDYTLGEIWEKNLIGGTP